MADKISAAVAGNAISQTLVSTSGSINADSVTIAFDDASTQDSIMSLIEKAKVQVADYYLKRAS